METDEVVTAFNLGPKPINSYPKVLAVGHRFIEGIFDGYVVVQEKIDGSQFSFGLFGGELMCRSKGKQIVMDAPEKMFKKAVEVVRSLDLRPDLIYRAEYLQKPKHNTLAYDRTPKNHLILFDIDNGLGSYFSPGVLAYEASRLDLESVPVLFVGEVKQPELLLELLERDSILGGQKIEGMVVKNYDKIGPDGKIFTGKIVSEKFKEQHQKGWKESNPSGKDFVTKVIEAYRTTARWEKAVQHLREEGILQHAPQDIGPLIREVQQDTLSECEDEIKSMLFAHFWPKINRGITAGLPEWYKGRLLESAFEEEE